jgi:hypothetical protein
MGTPSWKTRETSRMMHVLLAYRHPAIHYCSRFNHQFSNDGTQDRVGCRPYTIFQTDKLSVNLSYGGDSISEMHSAGQQNASVEPIQLLTAGTLPTSTHLYTPVNCQSICTVQQPDALPLMVSRLDTVYGSKGKSVVSVR